MLKRLVLSALVLFLSTLSASAQQPPVRRPVAPGMQVAPARATAAQWEAAYYAWVAGNYPDALQRAGRLLAAPNGDEFRDSVALMTGELFVTEEVAPDGNGIRWSMDSRTAGFTTGTGADRRLHLVDVSGDTPKAIAVFAGASLVFSPTTNEAAYFAISETPALTMARARLDSLTATGGGGGGFGGPAGQLRTEITRLEAEASRPVIRDLSSGQEREIRATGLTNLALRYGRDGALYLAAAAPGDAR